MTNVNYKYNSYIYARVSAMKGLLLRSNDYNKILKMDMSEIIIYLQDGAYKNEINQLANQYSGLKLINRALAKHLANVFIKLRKIANADVKFLLNLYLKRYDYINVKIILRSILAKQEDIWDIVIPVGDLDLGKLKELFKIKSVIDVLNDANLVKDFRAAYNEYQSSNNLVHIENLLDYSYFKFALEESKKIPNKGKLFREFFGYEVDVYNIKLILKKIQYKLDPDEIQKYLVIRGKDLSRRALYDLIEIKNLSDFVKALSTSFYGRILSKINPDLMQYEMELDNILLKKSILLFHQHPLTIDVILGYMFAKEIEIRNIRAIVNSKKFEMQIGPLITF